MNNLIYKKQTLVYRRVRFSNKHKFFEAQFGELDGIIDLVAERILFRTLYVDAM
jgi:hypothetical protein